MGESLTSNARYLIDKAFDKFAHIKGELLHHYYLRFTQLINDMNIYNMKLEQFQVNTKLLNNPPSEWRDDPIACLKNQATIQDGRVIVQQVQRRQGQSYSGNGYKGNATSSRGTNASGQAMYST
ncbi:hypothetical protein Tco_0530941 [Tanacetum coccineum]